MNREILRLAIPNIISNITVPLLSTVDTALMGRLGAEYIGAVGLGSMLFNYVYWNFGFLRMGSTGMTAQAYGAGNVAGQATRLGQGMLLAILLAAIMLILQGLLLQGGLFAFGVEDSMAVLVKEYFVIRIWAAPATLALYVLMGWFFGMQNAVYPLIIAVSINIVNIIVSYYLVYNQGMDISGPAWGTVIAQYFGILLAGGMLLWRYRSVLTRLRTKALFHIDELRHFLSLNRDLFLRTLLLTTAFFFFYRESVAQGALILAANTILLQFVNWMSYGVDGFAYAAESVVGKYQGAAQPTKTRRAVKLSFYWGMGLAVLFSLTYGLFGEPLLHVFTDEAPVKEAAGNFMIWMVIFPLLGTPCYIWDGIFIGITNAKAMRNAMVPAFIGYLAVWWWAMPVYGNHGLWAALTVFLVLRAIFLAIAWRKVDLA